MKLSPRTKQILALLAAVLVLALVWWARTPDVGSSANTPASQSAHSQAPRTQAPQTQTHDNLPPEAHEVLDRIRAGGPYEYSRDGITFQNREGLLPQRERGYYREYTVPTPGESDRGARRIVTGGDPVEAAWYSGDHYRSFTKIEGYP